MKKLLFLSILILALASCVNEMLESATQGQSIPFTASTEYTNLPETKTEYSGIDENGNTITSTSAKERINWLNTDLIRIYSNVAVDRYSSNHYADYAITPGTNSGAVSNASVAPATGNGLVWGTGSHNFYALYPAPGTTSPFNFTYKTVTEDKASIVAGTGGKAVISGSIPATQPSVKRGTVYKPNMNYAYMYAVKSGVSAGGTIDLAFKPLVTTFEVILKAGDTEAEGMKLKSVELVSTGTGATDLTGDFTATLSPDGTYTVEKTNTGRSIKISLSTSNQPTLNSTDEFRFTLFALPVQQTRLTLVLTFDKSGESAPVERRLELRKDGSWIKVPAGKKLYLWGLGVPGDVWHYTIEDVDNIIINGRAAGSGTSAIRTYRTSGSTTEYVPVTFQYSADGTNYSTTRPAGLTAFSMASTSDPTEKTLNASVGAHEEIDNISYTDEIEEHARILKARGSVGTNSYPYDLSMHKVTGEEREHPVTANSYVVGAPGVYMFPIIYGNALDWGKNNDLQYNVPGGGNVKSYKYTGSHENLTKFLRFDGKEITMPYILSDLGVTHNDCEAVVVWQDVPAGQEIITLQPEIKSSTTTWTLPIMYIRFEINKTTITESATPGRYTVTGARQGNIVIALRLKVAKTIGGTSYPAGTILWSWHIWVTDHNVEMNPIRVKTNGAALYAYNDMLPYHLGWCDEKVFQTTTYKTRTWYVKATQTVSEGTPVSKVFRVIQRGDHIMDQLSWSASTCYQWGRKDPMLPGYNKYTRTEYGSMPPEDFHPTNKPSSSPSGYTIVAAEGYLPVSPSSMTLAQTIQQPHVFNSGGLTAHNLWNANATGNNGEDRKVVKTVYDPCPPGYSLPHKWAFSNFNTLGTAASFSDRDITHVNAKDINGDGVLSTKDFQQDDGWHFYTGVGTNTIFFPGTTGRVNAESYVRYFHSGYIWTAARDSNEADGTGGFDVHYGSGYVFPWTSGTSHALTVRPTVEK